MKLIGSIFVVFFIAYPLNLFSGTEAFEVGPDRQKDLPGGKEADGIFGDFVIRNDFISAVISSGEPTRKANMSTHWEGFNPGTLYDLSLRHANNDQLTLFAPNDQRGPVSHVRVVEDGSNGKAVIETFISSARNKGLMKRHLYILSEKDKGIFIKSILKNESSEKKSGSIEDLWKQFTRHGSYNGIFWGDAINPADKAGYAYTWLEQDGTTNTTTAIDLLPGEETIISRFLTVGASPAQAFGFAAQLRGPVGFLSGRLSNEDDSPITTAQIFIHVDDQKIPAYPDSDGKFFIPFPPGEYTVTIEDIGRPSYSTKVVLLNDKRSSLNSVLPPAAKVSFKIQDELGQLIPCKAQFHGLNGTPTPNLGPQNRAHGCLEQYHSETGLFETPLPPGEYQVIVTKGIEYNHLSRTINLKEGETVAIHGTLHRVIDTRGWISTDYHAHSTPSGDNTCGTNDRIINLVAEHIEFAPTTEHNRFYDWKPHIDELGLSDHILTIPGIELTGPGAHFNAFPFSPEPFRQDNGAPTWHSDPRITAYLLREYQGANPNRWLQLNHPDMAQIFLDRNEDGNVDRGYHTLDSIIDAAETWGTNILLKQPFSIQRSTAGIETIRFYREFLWLQMLNRGHSYWCVSVSDAHSVHGNGVGGWRTYVTSSRDHPAEIDWKEIITNSKRGQMMVTNGPFLTVEAVDGTLPGGTTRAADSLSLKIKIQCTDWIEIDRVQILVNGRQPSTLNFTKEHFGDYFGQGTLVFDQIIDVPLSEDSHIIVVAMGENSTLKKGYGNSSQSGMKPCAYTNPIFVDLDGNGFEPNGDLLDWPLSVKGLTIEEAKALLNRAK